MRRCAPRPGLLLAALLAAPVSLAAQETPVPSWRWSVEEVRRAATAVGAGRSLQPESWPEGARVAVLLSFDVDNETVTLRTGSTSVGDLSQGEYGARVALPRVLDLLDRHRIPASFFIPAMSLELHPEMAKAIARSGRHEIGVHGWIHELNSNLPEEVERDLVARATPGPGRWGTAPPPGTSPRTP
jgi:peptidoglycan-N-acetylglucosamine deacetylase